MKRTYSVVVALLLVTGVTMLAGCGGSSEPTNSTLNTPAAPGGGSQLTGAGATFPYPLYSKWFDAYHQAHPEVQVNYQSIGSGGGIQQLKARTVDFGASDAPLSDKDAAEMPAPVVHLPTVAGAVALTYNLPSVTGKIKLTPEAVAAIFLGTAKKWNDPVIAGPNAGVTLPDTAIAVAHRSDGSGTSHIFTSYLAAVSPEWKQKVGAGKSVDWPVGLGGKGNEGVSGVVKQTPGGIGYVELAYALQNNLSYALVKNSSGSFVEPTVDSTTAAAKGAIDALKKDVRTSIVNAPGADAYPIAGFTYILLYKEQPDAAKGKQLLELLDWAIHDGQSLAANLHYAPVPKEVTTLNEATLASIESGGQPLLSKKSKADAGSQP